MKHINKIFLIVLIIFAAYASYFYYKLFNAKKTIKTNPDMNERVLNNAAKNNLTYSSQLTKTAAFIASN